MGEGGGGEGREKTFLFRICLGVWIGLDGGVGGCGRRKRVTDIVVQGKVGEGGGTLILVK